MPAHKHTPRPSYVQALPDQLLFDFEPRAETVPVSVAGPSPETAIWCNHCYQPKPPDSYRRDPRARDGRHGTCKRCEIDLYGSDAYKERVRLEERGLKQCIACGQIKPLGEYRLTHQKRRRPEPKCRDCANKAARVIRTFDKERVLAAQRERNRKNPDRHRANVMRHRRANWEAHVEYLYRWRKEQGEKLREHLRQWKREAYRKDPFKFKERNRRRELRKKGLTVVEITAEAMKSKMAYWGNRCWVCGGKPEAVDHVKPISANGPHVLANLRPICRTCNSRKGAKWPIPRDQLLRRY